MKIAGTASVALTERTRFLAAKNGNRDAISIGVQNRPRPGVTPWTGDENANSESDNG
jgi:hypothetical protein